MITQINILEGITKFRDKGSDTKRTKSVTQMTSPLFNFNPDTKKLPEDKAQLFHILAAKLPYP